MAVTFDAVGTVVTSNGVTTRDNTTLTVGGGSNRALIAQICWQSSIPAGITVIWDPTGTGTSTNQSCALITNASVANGTNCCTQLYGLVAPTSGNRTLRVSWTGVRDIYLQALSWTDVDQTGGVTSFPGGTSGTGTSTTSSVTVTSAVGDAVVAAHTTLNTIASVNNTQTFLNNTAASISGAGNRANGAASVSMTSTLTSAVWSAVGCSIKAAAASTIIPGGAFSDLTAWNAPVLIRPIRAVPYR